MTPHPARPTTTTSSTNSDVVKDEKKGLDVLIERNFLKTTCSSPQDWYETIITHARWYRVKYKSQRFGTECETPCWTCFYGGRKEYEPYTPVPPWLQPLVDKVSSHLGTDEKQVPFNAMLLRLYFDGTDEIAWHTDGRTFLGDTPTIASLSLGAKATFQMRRMHNVWPSVDGGGSCCTSAVDTSTPQLDFVLGDGDLLVMKGITQKHWHHRVPKQKGRKPRLNINFRYILQGADAERGQKTYYKYMVHGDENNPPSYTYREVIDQRGGIMKFTTTAATTNLLSLKISRSQSLHRKESSENEESKSNVKIQGKSEKENLDLGSIGNQPDTAFQKNLEDRVKAYLESETDVDVPTFLALPSTLQEELVNDWESSNRASLVSNNGTSLREASKKVHHNMYNNNNFHPLGNQRKKHRGLDTKNNHTMENFFSRK